MTALDVLLLYRPASTRRQVRTAFMAKQRRPSSKTTETPDSTRPAAASSGDRRRPSPRPERRPRSGASTYFEAVALYERGLEALQRHDYQQALDLLESVLRQYPEEKELHERVRLYLNICQRQADAARSRAADDRRAAVRRDARDQRRAVRPGDRAPAARPRRRSGQRSRALHARRRARAARRARRSDRPSRARHRAESREPRARAHTIPISSRCATTMRFAPRSSRPSGAPRPIVRRRPVKTRSAR